MSRMKSFLNTQYTLIERNSKHFPKKSLFRLMVGKTRRKNKKKTSKMASSCRVTLTSQKMTCEMYQSQLMACSLHLLRIVQVLVLGKDSEKKVVDAEKLNIPQLQELLRRAHHEAVFSSFISMLEIHEQCHNLAKIITNLCRAYLEILQLPGIALPKEPLQNLWGFCLRVCLEKPILLNINDDKQGTLLGLFRERLEHFYAECLQ